MTGGTDERAPLPPRRAPGVGGLALKVEGDVGVTLAEVVKRVAPVIPAVRLRRIRDLEREQIRVLPGRLA